MEDSWFADKMVLARDPCGCTAALSPDLTIKEAAPHGLGPEPGRTHKRTTATCGSRARPSCFDSTEFAFERVGLPHDPKLWSLSLRSTFFSARRRLVGRLHVCRRSAPQRGHWQVFSVADASPSNCMPGCAAIRVPIPDRNNGWLSTERTRITSVVVVIPGVGVPSCLDVS